MKESDIGTTRFLMGKYPVQIVSCSTDQHFYGDEIDECPEPQTCIRAKVLQECTITLMATDYDETGPCGDVPVADKLRQNEVRCFPAMWLHKKQSNNQNEIKGDKE